MNYSATCAGCGAAFKPGGVGMHARLTPSCTPEMRFWGKIPSRGDGCWLWQGAVNTTGYGMANWTAGQKNIVAHRLAYELLRGPIQNGMLALHKCDTPRCCNPDHLFFGTDSDNAQDKMRKGRAIATRPKLTTTQVAEIRSKYRRTLSASGRRTLSSNAAELAALYGVTAGTVLCAVFGRTWRNLNG